MTLQQAKDAVSSRYLGKNGIHAVGRRSKEEAVVLYLDVSTDRAGIEALVSRIREMVFPFRVLVEVEERPELH